MNKTHLLSLLLLCATVAHAQSTVTGNITVDGRNRSYRLFVPPAASSGDLLPLVVSLHGLSGNAFGQEVQTDMNPVADTAGFFVCYPNGTNRLLFLQGWWDYLDGTGGVDNVAFLDSLIDFLASTQPIDLNRVFMTGVSNGGGMTVAYGCARPDRVQAIAPIIGAINANNETFCTGDRPSMIDFHGTSDGIVPYNGQAGSLLWPEMPPVKPWLQAWVAGEACSPPVITDLPDTDPSDGTTVTSFELDACAGGKKYAHYRVNGGNHSVPGGPGGNNRDIHSSSLIWNFFRSVAPPAPRLAASKISLQASPQPATSQVVIPLAEDRDWTFELYSFSGQLQLLESGQGRQVLTDVSALPNGIYAFVVRTASGEEHSGRLSVSH